MASKSMLLKTVLVVAAVGILFLAVEYFEMLSNNVSQALPATQSVEPETNPVQVCFPNACIEAELAQTPEKRSQGLMFRQVLREGEGMLFAFETEAVYSFWMKNTLIPLDMIWVDSSKKVVHIEHAIPCTTERCQSYTPSVAALYVVEVNAGFAEENNIKIGDAVEFDY